MGVRRDPVRDSQPDCAAVPLPDCPVAVGAAMTRDDLITAAVIMAAWAALILTGVVRP